MTLAEQQFQNKTNIQYTVIIPTYNCADKLNYCLEKLSQMRPSENPFELIIIDNGSIDHTQSVAFSYQKQFDNFSYHYTTNYGLHIGRHLGAKLARGKILCYLDDDSFVEENWLCAIEKLFADPDVVLATGNNLPLYEGPVPNWLHFFWQNCEYGRFMHPLSILHFFPQAMKVPAWYVFGCNFIIRKELLFALGGFNPDNFPESLLKYRGDGETALSCKLNNLNYVAHYSPDIQIRHFVPKQRMTKEYFEKVHFRTGVSNSFSDIRKQNAYDYFDFEPNSNVDHTNTNLNYDDLIQEFQLSQEDYASFLLIKEACDLAYYQGYDFHQAAVKNDPQLLEWVLQENYL